MGAITTWLKQLVHLEGKEELSEIEATDLYLDGTPVDDESISVADALNVPAFQFGVETIANIVASLDIGLYSENEGKVTNHAKDKRLQLVNDDTGTYMLGTELKKAIVKDYYTHGEVFIYVKKDNLGNIISLNYLPKGRYTLMVDDSDPLNIYAYVQVNEKQLPLSDFIYLHRSTKNGVNGVGVVGECNKVLKAAYDGMTYTASTMSTGGVSRGVLQSQNRLSQEAMAQLKAAWKRLYSGNNDCIVLNEGITYKEIQQSSSEMQVQENQAIVDDDIRMLMGVFSGMLTSTKPEEYWNLMLQIGVKPILNLIESALNRGLLSPSEKGEKYFAFDTRGVSKINLLERYQAYEIALRNGFLTTNEVRYQEDYDKLDGLDYVRMSLADVLFNTKTGEIYTPNTNQSKSNNDDSAKGGEDSEIRD